MTNAKSPKELQALTTIISSLEGLDEDTQKRTMKAAAVYLGFPIIGDSHVRDEGMLRTKVGTGSRDSGSNASPSDESEGEEFFEKFNHSKPADNVKLIAAYLYREHGVTPFSVAELTQISNDVGITLPGRVDMTLKKAIASGKSLFVAAGRGLYKPTVHGEAFLKEAYGVKKGNKPKASQ